MINRNITAGRVQHQTGYAELVSAFTTNFILREGQRRLSQGLSFLPLLRTCTQRWYKYVHFRSLNSQTSYDMTESSLESVICFLLAPCTYPQSCVCSEEAHSWNIKTKSYVCKLFCQGALSTVLN